MAVGNRVSTANGAGTVRFVGTTSFAAGKWIGVELDGPTGKNNGSVQAKTYFSCRNGYGVFVRPAGVKIIDVSPRKTVDESARGVTKVQFSEAKADLGHIHNTNLSRVSDPFICRCQVVCC